jgi:hypothetical protein
VIAEGTATAVSASYRDSVYGNTIRNFEGTGTVRGVFTGTTTGDEATKPAQVMCMGNIIRDIRDTSSSDAQGVRPSQRSFVALNQITDCDRGVVPNDQGGSSGDWAPIIYQNQFFDNTSDWFVSSATDDGIWGIQSFGEGMTEATGSGTVADTNSTVDIDPGITGFNTAQSDSEWDVQITPNADYTASGVTRWWVTAATSNSQFRVKVDPACSGGTFTFNWQVIRRTKVDTA